jgi:2-dehydropantoate 2-reductase
MRIACFGAGGVGGYFAARLAQADRRVVVIARGAHLDAIRRDGLQLKSVAGDFVACNLEATDSPAQAGQVDAVFVCTKAWQVPDAAVALLPMLGPETLVVPLQNGVEAADQLAAVVGTQRVLGGLCRIVSSLDGPGRIRHAGLDPQLEFGERDGRRTPRVDALLAVFSGVHGVTAAVPDSIETAVWEKFLFIAPTSGVGATTRVPIGEFRAIAETRRMLEAAMREVATLARAHGVTLATGAIERTLQFVDSLPATATTSMQRDLMEGRPSELEAQSGAVVRLARAASVAVPVNECLYRALLPCELRARREKS